ncbi:MULTISPECIES: nickel-responsive transcriptional regulator NikR [Larsenimonas]|uniref:Putative nickel-responsive regulator n=1 Tax=Larsenimonas suaedae TaxID=1851019 RepID=A0ABU1GRV1_9GAMM|nr:MULTISPECIES: nickel-responsive transcriptional regulator NikR [Larsenimonas]MCM2972455.1 nickel-responsive transcriptional regulator NikR [Larsenimonas suaedae]MCM5704427.1 nickel-responsive transcriptional regulator NikR [Larsenimonas salina]MDR5894749.1 nickel-responsive transcriptional regulator NikR [Larsenimonas suaedae]
MQRVTITLDEDLLSAIDARVKSHNYQGRSEAVRDLLRTGLLDSSTHSPEPAKHCIATLSWVFDHATRDLAQRLSTLFHRHHSLIHTTQEIPLDHHHSMAVAVLKGESNSVHALTERVISERGVRHGRVFMVPIAPDIEEHAHGDQVEPHTHWRVRDS